MKDVDAAIRAFWSWWPDARVKIEAAIGGGGFAAELVDDIAQHVNAIDGELGWELQPGKTAHHAFCMSTNGDSELRVVTEMWRHRGPAADETWEYFAAKQPFPQGVFGFEGVELDVGDTVVAFEVDEGTEKIDGRYFHPGFADLAEKSRGVALFLMLDAAFGEDGVERWLGHIEAVDDAPDDGVPFAELVTARDALADAATNEKYAILKGTVGDEPVIVCINRALKRIDHLLYSMHVAIDATYVDGDADDDVRNALGREAVYFGRETRGGRRRVMHFYAPDDGAARSIIDRWIAAHPERDATVEWTSDPRWKFAKQF